jgi:hypothetical protein
MGLVRCTSCGTSVRESRGHHSHSGAFFCGNCEAQSLKHTFVSPVTDVAKATGGLLGAIGGAVADVGKAAVSNPSSSSGSQGGMSDQEQAELVAAVATGAVVGTAGAVIGTAKAGFSLIGFIWRVLRFMYFDAPRAVTLWFFDVPEAKRPDYFGETLGRLSTRHRRISGVAMLGLCMVAGVVNLVTLSSMPVAERGGTAPPPGGNEVLALGVAPSSAPAGESETVASPEARGEQLDEEQAAPGQPVAEPVPVAATHTLTVTVATEKADGKAWDVFRGQPDIAFCITSAGARRCLPGGTGLVEAGAPAQCQDAFACTSPVALAEGESSAFVEVFDVDGANNDTVGAGSCSVDRECRIGQATVLLSAL